MLILILATYSNIIGIKSDSDYHEETNITRKAFWLWTQVLDNGEFRKLYPGDTAITDGENPHSIKNDGYEQLRFIGIIVLD